MALLTELFIQIVHSREFVWLTFRVLAIRRGEKLTLDMYRRSTKTSLETNPFSQRTFPSFLSAAILHIIRPSLW